MQGLDGRRYPQPKRRTRLIPSTKMGEIFYISVSTGLVGGALVYLALYGGDARILITPGFGFAIAAGMGLAVGFGYYLLFKLMLRAFIQPFLQQTRSLVTRPVAPLPPPWASNELDRLGELLTEALATLERLDRFSTIAREIVATLDSPRVLNQVVSTAVGSLPADEGILFLLDPETGRYTASASYPLLHPEIARMTFTIEEIVPGWMGTGQHQCCIIAAVQHNPRLHPIFCQMGIQSMVSAPLAAGDRVIGLLSLFNHVESHAFDENDLRLACTYADLAAVAIDKARRYQEAHHERSKLAAILCESSDAVIVLDEATQVRLINPAAEHFLQMQAGQVIGLPLSALGVADLMTAFEATEVTLAPVLREVAAPGEKTLYASVSPIREVGWVIVMQDITLLKKLDQLRTDWVAAVSHDMKSPLTAMQMALGLLDKIGPLNETQREIINKAERGLSHLRSLVTNVLDSARLEAGMALRTAPVNLAEVITKAVAEVELLTVEKKQDLSCDYPSDLPAVCGDAPLLTRALVNLLDNAIKYSPFDSQISVRAWSQNGTVKVQVRDAGYGIPAEVLPHLFDRFYREPSHEQEIAGTGLGLNIVKRIVESHHGQIHVESTPGQGSTFTITLAPYLK